MGAELQAAAEVPAELRHRAGLTYPNPLAGNPSAPEFAAPVRTADGAEVAVADPKATRLAVALMNMNAVHGGAVWVTGAVRRPSPKS